MPAFLRQENWALPSLLLTLCSFTFVFALIPDRSGMAGAFAVLPLWLIAALGMFGVLTSIGIFGMMAKGVARPIAVIAAYARSNWQHMSVVTAFVFLAGMNMIAFMWMKPLLNYLVPFWADPFLADVDRIVFAGNDPWVLLSWMNFDATAIFYHRGWFALMIFTLILVLMKPPSAHKSALMLTYFLLWTVVGPVLHVLVPAAGPIFYDELGYGDRFTAIVPPQKAEEAARYLWGLYARGGFGPGAGISAMPSLHIATTAWIVIAASRFAQNSLFLVAPMAAAIFLLSISLGWHYAVDGIAGAVAAVVIWKTTLHFYSRAAACAGSTRLNAAVS